MYLAVLVARLVSLYSADEHARRRDGEVEPDPRASAGPAAEGLTPDAAAEDEAEASHREAALRKGALRLAGRAHAFCAGPRAPLTARSRARAPRARTARRVSAAGCRRTRPGASRAPRGSPRPSRRALRRRAPARSSRARRRRRPARAPAVRHAWSAVFHSTLKISKPTPAANAAAAIPTTGAGRKSSSGTMALGRQARLAASIGRGKRTRSPTAPPTTSPRPCAPAIQPQLAGPPSDCFATTGPTTAQAPNHAISMTLNCSTMLHSQRCAVNSCQPSRRARSRLALTERGWLAARTPAISRALAAKLAASTASAAPAPALAAMRPPAVAPRPKAVACAIDSHALAVYGAVRASPRGGPAHCGREVKRQCDPRERVQRHDDRNARAPASRSAQSRPARPQQGDPLRPSGAGASPGRPAPGEELHQHLRAGAHRDDQAHVARLTE